MIDRVSRKLGGAPSRIAAGLLALAALAACETVPDGPATPAPRPQVAGEAPPPATLPVDLADRAFTPAHMRGQTSIARIALLLPFSSPTPAVRTEATNLMRAAELALFERAGDHVLLMPKDTGGTPEGARTAAESALADGADLILGPLLSASVAAVGEAVQGRSVPVVAFSTDPSVAGGGIYLLSFPPGEEVRRIVEFTANRGATRYAFIGPANEYGYTVAQAYRASVEALTEELPEEERVTLIEEPEENGDGEIPEDAEPVEITVVRENGLVAEEFYSGGVQAMNEAAARLARLGVEALSPERASRMSGRDWEPSDRPPFQVVILPEGGDRLRTLAPVLIYQDIDPLLIKFVGTGLWHDREAAREPALSNGWFAGPDPQARSRFEAAFEAVHSAQPTRLAGLGYDAASLAALMAAEGAEFTRRALEDPDGFLGVDGLFRFREDGTIERGLAVYAVRNDGFFVLEPAPARFEDAARAIETEDTPGMEPAGSF